jgi:chromate reductase, NAD(P)H dehydrogenase (quinone)
MQQPEAYISGANKLFDADGKLTDEPMRGFCEKYIAAFATWIERHASK